MHKRVPDFSILMFISFFLLCGPTGDTWAQEEAGVLGIIFDDILKSEKDRLRLESSAGAIVHCVLPSAQSDVQVDDVVVSTDGKPILDSFDLSKATESLLLGESINVELIRNGERLKANWNAAVSRDNLESELLSLAEQGDLAAQIHVQTNYLHYNREGAISSKQKPINYFEALSGKDGAAVYYCLGLCYELGLGTSVDKKEAARLYRKAAKDEYPLAMHKIAWGYYERERPVPAQVHSWASKAAKLNNVDAINLLGWCCDSGYGVPQASEQAYKLYLSAAERGHPYGQFNVAQMLRFGTAGKQDFAAAFSWYKKSAEQGHPEATFQVGYAHQWGAGVEADFEKAKQMYLLAIERGSIAGQWGIGTLHLNGHGSPIDYSAAISHFKTAADAGYADAYNSLAVMFENGQGLVRNGTLATAMYAKAEKLGSYYATEQLRRRFAHPPIAPQIDN